MEKYYKFFLLLWVAALFPYIVCAQDRSLALDDAYKHHTQKITIGSVTPNINLKDINSNEASLSYLKGRYVLIHFWASWCRPCRQEFPVIKDIYNRYKNKTFNNGSEFLVLSVSLDDDLESWKKAVHENNVYEFVNVIDPEGVNSDIAKRYNVSAIPAAFLIDGEGKLVAKSFKVTELSKILDTYVN